ncbi:MAG: GrpB family protein [Saccharofermentanales bacterium]
MNLSIVDWFGYNLSPQDRMRAIKEAGFAGVMLLWADYFDKDYKLFPEYARNAGLYVDNAHAPYLNANLLWEDTISGQEAFQEIIRCLEDCAKHGVPTLVMHPENKNGTETVSLPHDFAVGIERMKRIIDAAERLDVNVAVENMSRPEYLEQIFTAIQSRRLGFCFDSGHCNVFTPDVDLLALYGDKLMALHLHDNNGTEDWHALPFSGNIDWSGIAAKLHKLKYDGAIALEIGNTRFEQMKSPDEFLKLAVKSVERIFAETDEERQSRIYPIILSEYNPAWPEWFAEEKANLEQLIGVENIARISHFGSTSVPGLAAKPTVDILLEVQEDADLNKLIDALPSPDYIYLHQESAPTISTPLLHLMFLKGYLPDGYAEKVYHIHVVRLGDWDEKLCFRDYLIAHPETTAEYAELKRGLFQRYEHDHNGYTEAKTEFIKAITRKAKEKANGDGSFL